MTKTLYLSVIFAALGLPALSAQSLETEYEMLKKRHLAAAENAIVPIDRKFTAAADEIAARALRQSDPLAEVIKAERIPPTLSQVVKPVNPFENTYWKFEGWGALSMVRIEPGGVAEEYIYSQGTGKASGGVRKWELVNSNLLWAGNYNLRIKNGKLVRSTDGIEWSPSTKATFYKFMGSKDLAEASAVFHAAETGGAPPVVVTPVPEPTDKPTLPAAPEPTPKPNTPFGREETPFGTR